MGIPYGFGFGEIAIVILIALFVFACIGGGLFLIIWVLRRPRVDSSMPVGGRSTPLQIAQERYARGEISRDEYQQIVSDLQKQA